MDLAYIQLPELSQAAISILCFVVGNITGYLFHDMLKKSFSMNDESSKVFLMVVVTITWVISMIVDVVSPSYDVPAAVHALMGLIVGFFFWRPREGGK